VSYNVENLFHPEHDTILKDERIRGLEGERIIDKDDYEWTPEGERRWSYTRYYRKEENIARVLTSMGEWSGVDIVGLQEIENAAVVKRLCYTMRRNEYDFVHYESPDPRGIDVALIYKKSRVDTIRTRKLSCEEGELKTRDILYVKAQIDKSDTLHLFVCHLPSQRGGAAESEWKRTAVKAVLQNAIDSVYALHPEAKMIVMGDMNSDAPSVPLKGEELRGVRYQEPVNGNETGTHKWQGRWSCLDRFYTSPALDSLSTVQIFDAEWIQEADEKYLGLRPKRTFNGYRYQKDGFSDHLPIVLMIK
jgi:endonuclease/exonuclease/phosphatase family metal-dependent hydrolase